MRILQIQMSLQHGHSEKLFNAYKTSISEVLQVHPTVAKTQLISLIETCIEHKPIHLAPF